MNEKLNTCSTHENSHHAKKFPRLQAYLQKPGDEVNEKRPYSQYKMSLISSITSIPVTQCHTAYNSIWLCLSSLLTDTHTLQPLRAIDVAASV